MEYLPYQLVSRISSINRKGDTLRGEVGRPAIFQKEKPRNVKVDPFLIHRIIVHLRAWYFGWSEVFFFQGFHDVMWSNGDIIGGLGPVCLGSWNPLMKGIVTWGHP